MHAIILIITMCTKRLVVEVATRKRKTAIGASSIGASIVKQCIRQVSKDTFQKWQQTHEKEHPSMMCLCAEMDGQDKSLVSMLWCFVCRQYKIRICGHKSISRAWIDGSSNHKMSNITDHANSEPHKVAMMYFH